MHFKADGPGKPDAAAKAAGGAAQNVNLEDLFDFNDIEAGVTAESNGHGSSCGGSNGTGNGTLSDADLALAGQDGIFGLAQEMPYWIDGLCA